MAGDGTEPPTRDFQFRYGSGTICYIGRQLKEFKHLKALRCPSIFRSKPIATNRSGKVVTK